MPSEPPVRLTQTADCVRRGRVRRTCACLAVDRAGWPLSALPENYAGSGRGTHAPDAALVLRQAPHVPMPGGDAHTPPARFAPGSRCRRRPLQTSSRPDGCLNQILLPAHTFLFTALP